MLNEKEKQMVDDILNSYDSLMDDSPAVVRNLLKSKRESVVIVVETRFPALRDLTQQQVATINNLQTLDQLLRQVAMVPDEGTLRWLLSTYNDATLGLMRSQKQRRQDPLFLVGWGSKKRPIHPERRGPCSIQNPSSNV